jgi:trk system potassium uptake protein TrkH
VKRILFIASKKVVREILIIIALYIAISFITGSILSSRSGSSFEDAMFESVSALTTTGLTAGVTSIDLDSSSKVMLTVNMILGRFEIIAILYIFVSYLRR